jgi:nicotinamidase-related amidase
MPEKNVDLHGSAPDKHKFALLLIDVINDFDFPEGDQLLKHARPMARILLRLKRRAQKAGVPVIYINDYFGRWKSDFRGCRLLCTTRPGRRYRQFTEARRRRLFRAQTKTFRFFFDYP